MSRQTVGRDPQRHSLAGNEYPIYHTMVDTPASVQGNFLAPRSSRGGSLYAPRENVYHHESPFAALVEVRDQFRLIRWACRRFAAAMNAF